MMSQHWVVVGLMGSGKTTVGAQLAARAGRAFIDNDEKLFEMTGRTAREIREERGLEALHELERRALASSLNVRPAAVIAAAASVVGDEATRDRIRENACVLWLDVSPADLGRRVAVATHRPIEIAPVRQFEVQRAQRSALFAEVADVVVDGTLPPDRIAELVLPTFQERDAVS